MNELQNNATMMGLKLENAIGTPEHRAKWIGKLTAFGLSRKSSESVYADAMESRRSFDNFSEAIRAFAGAANGIESAPVPGRAGHREWNR